MSRALCVVIAGGGTGGHLYPGIAVARELLARRPDATVTFAGTARGIEARVLPREGFALDTIRSGGLKGKSIAHRLRGAALIPLGMVDAWRIVSARRPSVVIGVGGYSSGPVVLTAALRGVPTMVLEQNAVPGLTNKVLARWVRAAAVTYQQTLPFFAGKGFVSGNPVREEFFDRTAASARPRAAGGQILVLGGSQGAHAINMAMVAAAPELVRAQPGLRIVHQTGEGDLSVVTDAYRAARLEARAEPFLDRVADEMRDADIVICRAGATTLAELAATGRPAIVVPLPTATDDHQRKNAEVFGRSGGALVIDERALSGEALADALKALVADPDRRARMSAAARTLARPDAAERIADRVEALGRAR